MIVFFNTALLIINQIQIIFRQWNRYLKRFPSAPRSTLTKTLRLMTGNETTHSSMLQHSRRLQGMKARNSVRSGGYAVISSTIIGMRRTRPNLDSSFCLFSWDLHLIWVSRYPCSDEQAALAHLESIIYDPHEADASHYGPNGVDGEDGTRSGSEDATDAREDRSRD